MLSLRNEYHIMDYESIRLYYYIDMMEVDHDDDSKSMILDEEIDEEYEPTQEGMFSWYMV